MGALCEEKGADFRGEGATLFLEGREGLPPPLVFSTFVPRVFFNSS
jgi:hypothetical protein